MTEARDGEIFVLPATLCRSAVHALLVAGGAQKAAVDELADLNRGLFRDLVDVIHSLSLLSNEFWHARTAAAATRAVEGFVERQERILRRESHRWTEHCHRLLDGAFHSKDRACQSPVSSHDTP